TTDTHGPLTCGRLLRCVAARMVRMGSPVRFRRPLLRWRFRLVGSDGWGRDEVRVRPRTAVQTPGQLVGVLASLPASSLPGVLELNHTVPRSQPHPPLHSNRTIQPAHCGPPDRVEVLERVDRACHGRIILTTNTTRKTSTGDRLRECRSRPVFCCSLGHSELLGAGVLWEQGVAWPRWVTTRFP